MTLCTTYRQAVLVLGILLTPGVQGDDAAYGEYLSSSCLSCHSLRDTTQALPALTSYDQQTLEALLKAYRETDGLNPAMQNVARSLSDEEISALACYFTQLKP